MLERYEVLTVLRETYLCIGGLKPSYHDQPGYQGHSGLNMPASLQPQVLAYTAQDFGNELKSRLSCLLSGDTALERCIDATVEAMKKRLDATQELGIS